MPYGHSAPDYATDMASIRRAIDGYPVTVDYTDQNMGWVSEAMAVASFLASFGDGIKKAFGASEGKERYNAVRPQMDKLVQAYGTNIQSGAAAAGLDPNLVAKALSDYLRDRGVNLTPAQLLGAHPPPAPPAQGINPAILAALAVGAAYFILR